MTTTALLYMRCPRCAAPTATRDAFIQHIAQKHGADILASTMKHGVAQDDAGRWYSIMEDSYSDSTCMFDNADEAQKQDDRMHAHMLCIYPNAKAHVGTVSGR